EAFTVTGLPSSRSWPSSVTTAVDASAERISTRPSSIERMRLDTMRSPGSMQPAKPVATSTTRSRIRADVIGYLRLSGIDLDAPASQPDRAANEHQAADHADPEPGCREHAPGLTRC